jgi:2-keto-4-pentenoate hydratase
MADLHQTSEYLLGHWRHETRCENLPADLQPSSKAEAYAIQSFMEQQSAVPLWGWKIAATSIAGQKHIGVTGPLAGRYIAERVVASGQSIPFGRNHMNVAEVEFAFRLGADLPPRSASYTVDEVFAAVASLHPAIEIPDSRYDRFETVGEFALIADNACAHWLVIGEAAPEVWRDMDLAAFMPTGRVIGKGEWQGKGANVLGGPRIALTWIANELSALGIGLKAGQTVTTGTCLVPMAIAAGDRVEGDFGVLGQVVVTMDVSP